MTPTRLILSIILTLIFPVLVILISGDWHWIEGWIFVIWFIVMCLASVIYLYYKDPALLAERAKPGTNSQEGWDKYFLRSLRWIALIWFVVMPLDAKRFGWTPDFPLWIKISGGIALLISFFFLFRSLVDNTFASSTVRIQTERNQRVISTGVYAFVRHPMYLGAVLMLVGTPVLLGSKYGILLGIIFSFAFVARILGEEKMLTEKLEGYADYKKKVKYRLFPFIW